MVAKSKGNHPLDGGTYIIRTCTTPNPSINLAVDDRLFKEPYACIWKTTRSPTQFWNLEPTENGYHIRNRSTNKYFSHKIGENMRNGVLILALDHAVEWKIEEIVDSTSSGSGHIYHIQLLSEPKFSCDLAICEPRAWNGCKVHLFEWHGRYNQQWMFERVMDEQPPSYNGEFYLGAIPAGIYLLGQPEEESKKAQSKAALSVAATRPVQPKVAASTHLSIIGIDGPFPNQIWDVEAGLHGYRLKNIATKSYLNCVNRTLVAESLSNGPAGATEWIFGTDLSTSQNDVVDFRIHPSIDHTLILGVSMTGIFHHARVKPLAEYLNELKTNFTQWRLEAVEESSLESA
ncbi:hypothetical protein FRC02_001176 [Tulasnella sp. 418]|nr:hypothetical protein FRC02_001176 [Tulasnella sp. 418]